MFQAMLLAATLVAASGAAFLIGGENQGPEPGLPGNTDMMLTYEVEGTLDGAPVNGSLEVRLQTEGTGHGISYSWPYNITGNLGPLASMPTTVLGWDCFLMRSIIDTPWGEKQGLLSITQRFTWNDTQGVVFCYRGAQTGLTYRLDLVAPEAKATYVLADVNITGMEALDLRAGEDVSDLVSDRHVDGESIFNFGGSGSWGLLEPRPGESYRVSVNATGYTFMAFSEQDMLSMAVGGDFSYAEEWSFTGNWTKEFVLSGQMMFYYLYPNGNAPGTNCRMAIEVV